ncbi:transposase [Escherichia coli]|nr:transposase [Escherichia coli]
MTKTVSTSKKPRKQHSPEFRSEALKLAERIGVTAAARELSLYESQLYNWRSKQQNQRLLNVNWRCLPRLHVSNASWQNGMKSWLSSKRPRHTSRSA